MPEQQQTSEEKAYEEKIKSELEQARTKLHEAETQFKTKATEAQNQAIQRLKTAKSDLEKKYQELKAAGGSVAEAKTAQIKAEVQAALTNLNARLAELPTKPKAHGAPKAS